MPGRIAFILAEGHGLPGRFPPLARAAREIGLDLDVVGPNGQFRRSLEEAGARFRPISGDTLRSFNPLSAGYTAGQVGAVLKESRADIVHCVGLGPTMLGGAACVLAGVTRRVYSPGPLGRLATRTGAPAWMFRRAAQVILNGPLRSAGTRILVDTFEDLDTLKLPGSQTLVVNGYGVDPSRLHPLPMPPSSPLKIAIAAPMTPASGIDVAVEAVRLARSRGAALEVSLFADADDGGATPSAGAGEWTGQPGVTWRGPAPDVGEPWRDCHVACLPSRGGQGTPRSLIEAAGCGRAIVTTDVAGCRDVVKDGTEGVLVPAGDAEALADAFVRLAADPVLPPLMGAAARARVLHDFLERDLVEAVARVYADLLGESGRA